MAAPCAVCGGACPSPVVGFPTDAVSCSEAVMLLKELTLLTRLVKLVCICRCQFGIAALHPFRMAFCYLASWSHLGIAMSCVLTSALLEGGEPTPFPELRGALPFLLHGMGVGKQREAGNRDVCPCQPCDSGVCPGQLLSQGLDPLPLV